MATAPEVEILSAHRVVLAATQDPRWHVSFEVDPEWSCSAAAHSPALSLGSSQEVPAQADLALLGVARRGADVVVEVRGGPLARDVDERTLVEHHLAERGLEPFAIDAPADVPVVAARDVAAPGCIVFGAARAAPGRVFVASGYARPAASDAELSQLVRGVISLRVEGAPLEPRAEARRAYDWAYPASFTAQAPVGYSPTDLIGESGRSLQLELEDRAGQTLRGALTIAAFAQDQFASEEGVLSACRSMLDKRKLGCALSLAPASGPGRVLGVLRDAREAHAVAAEGHVDVRLAIGRLAGAWVVVMALGPSRRLEPAAHMVHRRAFDVARGTLRTSEHPLGAPGDAPGSIPLT